MRLFMTCVYARDTVEVPYTDMDTLGNFGRITLSIALINSGGIPSESASAGRQDGENFAGVP